MKTIIALVALGLGMHGIAVAQVVLQDEGEVRVAQGGRVVRLKVDPKSVGAAQFVVGTELMPPGAVLPTHRHPNQEDEEPTKALGLTIPQALLLRADQVIE
jgi:hypothetical protein